MQALAIEFVTWQSCGMAPKKPRPKAKSVPTIFVRVDRELKDAVARACDSERRTEKEVVCAALREYLKPRALTPPLTGA